MDRKLEIGARMAIAAAALIVFIASLGVFFAAPLAPFVKILALILSSQALGWAGTVALTGSPGRAWRAMGGAA